MGVNVFFVLSGFLITSLLLGEWTKRLTIHLGQFWERRARRLLPALLLMLVGVAIYARVFAAPGEFSGLRLDSLSTLFYVANWHFIAGGSSYFAETAQPSPLSDVVPGHRRAVLHRVAAGGPVDAAPGSPTAAVEAAVADLATAVIGALASALDMRLLYLRGASVTRPLRGNRYPVPRHSGWSIARHRNGHLGATPRPTARPDRSPSAIVEGRFAAQITPITAWEIKAGVLRASLQLLGWAALIGCLVLWTRVDTSVPFLFEGGYLVFAVAVAVVIFCTVTAQAASLSRALGNVVFRYIGKISYGAYLWHIPIFLLFDAARVHLYGLPLLVVRIGATLLVATASFYLVEQPIRRGRMRSITEWKAWLVTSTAFLGVVGGDRGGHRAGWGDCRRSQHHPCPERRPVQGAAGGGHHGRGLPGLHRGMVDGDHQCRRPLRRAVPQ